MALKSFVEITGPKGKREVSLDDFFTLPKQDILHENILSHSEIISQIRVPRLPSGSTSAYLRQGEKESFDWPLTEVAVVLQQSGGVCSRASVVLGAVAPVPLRATAVEDFLKGKTITEAVAEKAGALSIQGVAPLSHNRYKTKILPVVVKRAILKAMNGRGKHSHESL